MSLNSVIKQISKIHWQYILNRQEALLFKSITDTADHFFSKTTGINWHGDFILRFSSGEFYYSSKRISDLRLILKSRYGFLEKNFCSRLVKYVGGVYDLARSYSVLNTKKLTSKKLTLILKKYYLAAQYGSNFLIVMPNADAVISQELMDLLPEATLEKKREWLGILTYPHKENEHTKEERDFYKLIIRYKKTKNNFLLIKHLKKYQWIGMRQWWFKNTWTIADLRKRVAYFIKQRHNPRVFLSNLDIIREQKKRQSDCLLTRLSVKGKSKLKTIVKIAKELAYLRTWGTDTLYRCGHLMKGLFFEVARRASFPADDVVFLTFPELISMAHFGVSPVADKEVRSRKAGYLTFLNKQKYSVISDKEKYSIIRRLVSTPHINVTSVKGEVAYPGLVCGRAKIVLMGQDIFKVKPGDVLVTVMTFPNFVPAMEKASAFVTDEGGILCHAAIVAREIKKPCLIATKVATKIFKDGDLVEVDANKGVVRRI